MKNTRQVFVSHTKVDAALAHKLAVDLTTAGIRTWIAPESIRPGEGWVDAINRGLKDSTDVVVLLTPAAVESMWVHQEISAAIALERKGRLRLIPLGVERCDVPPLWETYQQISLTPDYETGARRLIGTLSGKVHREGRHARSSSRVSNRRVDVTQLTEIDSYARLYDGLYPRLPDDLRNYVLNAVLVDQLFQLGSSTRFSISAIKRLFSRSTDGDRMVALLLLQTAPSPDGLDMATDAIAHPRSPFEQYHGLRSADLMLHMLDGSQKQKLRRTLETGRRTYLIPANRSRWEVYSGIVAKLSRGRNTSGVQ